MKTIRPTAYCYLFIFLLGLLGNIQLLAQPQEEPPFQRYSLQSPYHTIYSLLYNLQPNSYRPQFAAPTIYGVRNQKEAEHLAIQLKQVLDGNGLYVLMNELPQDRSYVDTLLNKSIYVLFPTLPEVYVEKIEDGWYFSKETVDAIPRLHQATFPFGSHQLPDFIPEIGHKKLGQLELWQYLGIILLLLLAIVAHRLVRWLFKLVIDRLDRTRLGYYIKPELKVRIASILSLVLLTQLLIALLPTLQLPIEINKYVRLCLLIGLTVFVVICFLRITELIIVYLKTLAEKTPNTLDDQLLPLLQTTAKVVISIIGLMSILRLLGVDLTTLLAGVSIGGLAVALAAQDTIKNVFGSIMIFADRPFQIGDWVSFAGAEGTVEQVGLRSTRIRSFTNSLITVPNSKITDAVVNNLGARIYRRFKIIVGIHYNTPTELIETFIEGVRTIIIEHPKTKEDAAYVYLNSLNDSSLGVLVQTFLTVENGTEEARTRQEILLNLLKLAQHLGVEYAFPSTSIYVEQMPKQINQEGEKENAERSRATHQQKLQQFIDEYRYTVQQRATPQNEAIELFDGENEVKE